MLGPLEQYVTPTLDAALLISSRAGADLGQISDRKKGEKVKNVMQNLAKNTFFWFAPDRWSGVLLQEKTRFHC